MNNLHTWQFPANRPADRPTDRPRQNQELWLVKSRDVVSSRRSLRLMSSTRWTYAAAGNKIKREGWAELCYTQTLICLYTWVHTTSCMGSMFILKGLGLSVATLLRWPKKLPFMTFGPPQVHKPLGWYSSWALRKSGQIMQAITQAIKICYDNPSRQLSWNSLLHISCKSACTQQNMCIYVYYSCVYTYFQNIQLRVSGAKLSSS